MKYIKSPLKKKHPSLTNKRLTTSPRKNYSLGLLKMYKTRMNPGNSIVNETVPSLPS